MEVAFGKDNDPEATKAAFRGIDVVVSTVAHVKRSPEQENALGEWDVAQAYTWHTLFAHTIFTAAGGPAPKNHEMFRQV